MSITRRIARNGYVDGRNIGEFAKRDVWTAPFPRICTAYCCTTQLNRYHKGTRCYLHEHTGDAPTEPRATMERKLAPEATAQEASPPTNARGGVGD